MSPKPSTHVADSAFEVPYAVTIKEGGITARTSIIRPRALVSRAESRKCFQRTPRQRAATHLFFLPFAMLTSSRYLDCSVVHTLRLTRPHTRKLHGARRLTEAQQFAGLGRLPELLLIRWCWSVNEGWERPSNRDSRDDGEHRKRRGQTDRVAARCADSWKHFSIPRATQCGGGLIDFRASRFPFLDSDCVGTSTAESRL